MADFIKVNTALVAAAAKNIANYNAAIRNDFSDVESAIKALNNDWDGNAASNAIGSYNAIKGAFYETRYKVIDDYVNYLHHIVDDGYTQTENANKSLAEQFK